MAYVVTCPSCGNSFDPGESIKDQVQKDLRLKMVDWQKMKDDEFRKKEIDFQKTLQQQQEESGKLLQAEKTKLQQELQESIRKSMAADYENQLKMLQQNAQENAEKLKEARTKELEFLQKEQELKNREAELEIQLQKRMLEERTSLTEQIRKEETERGALKETELQLRMRELEKQLEDQKKLAEEMKRKAEQGSMQLQGEVQELMLEEILKATFPFDEVKEVGKGVRGADCIQMVRNQFGQEAGKIIYESKRTKDFAADWIEKLKADMRSLGADVAVIVTQALPKDMDRFGEKDGVYICTFAEAKSMALVLRNAILKIADARKSQENKGDKMVLLYDYLTGNEFSEQWKAIREGFMSMRLSIQRERDAMEKLWKAREKQLEKVMLNAAHIRGSIEGIAGTDAVNLNLLDDNDTALLD
ncbi:hypothetical protein SAMN05421788_108248 [Filimonas lacunae]|uniref:DUF2130 domain-containing protein n=1 Tax=Filimonas lacunae TaxID=477680 RepID=A0A173MDL1_9BACT|nr:DUF2130 domain-containing protein [Filimonas lacunae]BAV05607.1 hypothetical protein FLA_1618 [Filimonas lacunae]SIT29213.1 hypothetical protein SAMN05421788_108248 [Filimonas lacunae]